jgi:pimeloyl-ACP methyl ester carboxylesterase
MDGEVAHGSVHRQGQRIAWQEFGAGDEVLLLLPTWSIVHTGFWREQLPHFADRYRVLAFDGLGNGASDRPVDPRRYGDHLVADDAISVLDARHIDQAVVLGVSQGGPWALALAALHPERVTGAVFIAPNVPLAPGHPERVRGAAAFDAVLEEHEGWGRWNRRYWLEHYEDFLAFFFSECFPEPGSEQQIAHFLAMGLETTGPVLVATRGTEQSRLTAEQAVDYARRLRCPSLVLHGDDDHIAPIARGEELARLAGSELVRLPGTGHEPECRIPEVVNARIDEFLAGALSRSAA